jgi:hypothetical protein
MADTMASMPLAAATATHRLSSLAVGLHSAAHASSCSACLVCRHRCDDRDDATGLCDLDPHAVDVACEVCQRLARLLLHGGMLSMCEHAVKKGSRIALCLARE